MQTQKIKQKSKHKSKQRPSSKNKRSQSLRNQSQKLESNEQDVNQYFQHINEIIRNTPIEIDVNAEVNKLLKLCKKYPTESLTSLCNMHQFYQSSFYEYQTQSKGKSQKIRPIFEFLWNQIHFYRVFPFMKREKTVIINQGFLKWLQNKHDSLSHLELKKLNDITTHVLSLILEGESERIIENMLYFVFKIPIVLGTHFKSEVETKFCQEMIKDLTINLVHMFDKNIKITQETQDFILQFHRNSFHFLILASSNPSQNYHLFDFAFLSFTSKNGDICRKILAQTFSMLRILIEEKREESKEDGSIDPKSIEESDMKINAVLLASSFLKFNSVLQPSSHQRKGAFIKEITLLILLSFKQHILRLIDELEKLQKSSIPSEVIRGMFQISKFCNNINHLNQLPPIIMKIQSVKQLADCLASEEKLLSTSSPKDQEPFEALVKNVGKVLFEIMCRIQKTLCHYNLEIFMDLYVEHPLTFRSEYFIEQTFKNQHEEIILKFMRCFTSKWLLAELKIFDFNFYLLHFIRKCIAEDKMNILGRFIKEISIQQLLRINLHVYKLSFEDDNKKYIIPQNSERMIQFASLTSAGYCEKFMLINQIMPNFSQQLVWRTLINHLVHSLHFIVVKSFYNVAAYEVSITPANFDSICKMINLFQNYIDQQQIEEAFATFQLLHCILSRKNVNYKQDNQVVDDCLQEKCQARLLQVVLAKSRNLMTMHQIVCNRRRAAMNSISSTLSKEMMTENLRCFDRLKKMNTLSLRSIHNWLQNLRNIKQHIVHHHSYEDIIQAFLQLSKDNDFRQFHQVRYLSHYCSEKYFNNIIQTKVKNKLAKRQIIASNFLMVLREIMNNFMMRYHQQGIENSFSIKDTEILEYYEFVLKVTIDVANEREILKSKLIVLYQIMELTAFFKANPDHQLFSFYHQLHNSLKQTIVEIAIQNPQLVSKYQRQFILHFRTVAITQIIKNIQTDFQILNLQQSYSLFYEACFDKYIEIRFMLINMLSSRFKHDMFKKFLSDKYQIATLTTNIAIFESSAHLKTIATRITESFKGAGSDYCSMGLVILLHSIKHILTLTFRNLHKQEYLTYIDSFLTHFHKLWLNDKEEQYSAYSFASKFIEERKMNFIISSPSYQSQIQTYYVDKEGSDYYLEREIKEYLKKQQDFSFEFPPDEAVPNLRNKLISNLMYSLPYRIFAKMKQIIEKKFRSNRTLKYKKDIYINCKLLQYSELLSFYSEKMERQIVTLRT